MRRRDALVSLQQKVGQRWAKTMVGKTMQVLVDGQDEDGYMIGRTQFDAPDIDNIVMLSDAEDESIPRLESGQMRECKIIQNLTFDLIGYPVS